MKAVAINLPKRSIPQAACFEQLHQQQWVFVYHHWCEENEMGFVSHEVPFPAKSDRRSRVAGNGTECEVKTIELSSPTSGGEQWSFLNFIIFIAVKKTVLKLRKMYFLHFGTVFLTAVRMKKWRKAHCSPPLVDEDNSMVFTSHSVPFPATRDLRSLVAGNGTSWETKTISFSSHQWR